MNLRPGRLVAALIVASWAGILGTHFRQSYAPRADAALVDLSAPIGAGLTQRGVFYRGARIGYIREKITPLDDGIQAEQEGQFTLNVMGRERVMDIEGAARLGENGKLAEFTFRLTTSSGRSPFETRVRGRVIGEDELELTISSGGRERTETRPLRAPIVLPITLYYSLASQGLEVGQTYRLRLFDPMTLTEGEIEISVLEREIVRWGDHEEDALRLRSRFAGLTTMAWVNEAGELLKEETSLGWTLIKEIPGSALQARSAGDAPDVITASAIPSIGFSGRPETLERTRLRLNNFPELWEGMRGGRQRLSGKEVVIEIESLPLAGSAELSENERRAALGSDAFIQADDPEIRRTAGRLSEGLAPLEAARALERWVHENVRKTPTLSIPSAREVLEQRVGDCNEHTVLFTALARATGIPTRMVIGLAWSTGQFYYHAWSEVWINGWIAVDPTFGQFPADPLHLRLLTGGLERQYEVLKLMGRGATIEVLEAE